MNTIKTKKIGVVDGQTVIVGVDMSKDKHFGCWLSGRNQCEAFAFWNNCGGLQEFWNQVLQAKNLCNLDTIVFGYASAGSFAEPLVRFMRARGAHMVQVNPIHTQRVKDLQVKSVCGLLPFALASKTHKSG
jgi:hypothetical protein